LQRDFAALADVVELDSNLMHAVMMTSAPRLIYWQPATLGVMQAVQEWREAGLEVCYTIDAGPKCVIARPRTAGKSRAAARAARRSPDAGRHPGRPARLGSAAIEIAG
jgi:diphosphomevalonate decarboxylase